MRGVVDFRSRLALSLQLGASLIIVFFFSNCASVGPNSSQCKLPPGVAPLPPCHKPGDPTWQTFDGTKLPYVEVTPPLGAEKAVVIVVPGWDAVTGDYLHLMEGLAAKGYCVCASENRAERYDPVEARRGEAVPWHDWVADLTAFTEWVAKRHPGKPIFYHGHSFGTLIVIEAEAEAEKRATGPHVQGVILHSPAFPMLDKDPLAPSVTIGRLLSFVRIDQVSWSEAQHVGPVGDEVDNCRWFESSDRLKKGYSLGFLIKTVELGHAARRSSHDLRVPVMAMEGLRDRVVAPVPRVRKEYHDYLTQELCGGHATVKVYPEGFHLITEGASRNQAMADVVAWMNAHLPNKAG